MSVLAQPRVGAVQPRLSRPATAIERLRLLRLHDTARGWIVTFVVTGIAAATRLWSLGFPKEKIFDEVYYPQNAVEILHQGYEANPGHLFVVHPPLGKWCIAAGIELFGNNSVGWRFPSAIAGTTAVFLLIRLVRRMTGSTMLGGIAGLLLTFDGLSLVMSRTSLLDIFMQPFILAGFFCLVLDRDQVRGRLAAAVEAAQGQLRGTGPALGPRPWRLAGGVLLGASCGIKWSAVYFVAGFAILSLFWDYGARKSAGVPKPIKATWLRDMPTRFVSLTLVPIGAYLLTWTGWFLGDNGYDRHWADDHPSKLHFIPGALRSLVQYQRETLKFHEGLSSYHPYRSQPWAWLLDARPVNFYYPKNVTGCGSNACVRQIVCLGTPALWWTFIPAILWMVWLLISRRDWRAGVVLMAFAAGWATWLENTSRTMFFFYMVPLVPFLVLGVTLVLGDALGRRNSSETRHIVGLAAVCVYLALVVINFTWLWPILTGQKITQAGWQARMWFSSWI